MNNIVITLTPQEAQWFLGFLDLGLKNVNGGVAVLDQAAALKAKLTAAANAAEAKPELPP